MPDHDASAGVEALLRDVAEILRDAVRKLSALESRIDAMPDPLEVSIGIRDSVLEQRAAVEARVGALGDLLSTLGRRVEEVTEALVPLEGLRTEVATVADRARSLDAVPQAIAGLGEHLREVPDRLESLHALVASLGSIAPADPGAAAPAPAAAPVDTGPVIDAIRDEVRSISDALTRSFAQVTDALAPLDGVPGAVASVAERIARIESAPGGDARDDRVADALARLADLPDALARLGDVPDALARLGDVPDTLARLGDVPDTLGRLGDVPDALARLEGHVRTLPEQLDALLASVGTTAPAAPAPASTGSSTGEIAAAVREELRATSDAIARSFAQVTDALAPIEDLRSQIGSLARAPESGAATAPSPDALVAAVRDEVRTASATIAAEVQAIVREASEGENTRTDQLGLRLTNLSMSVTQTLDALRERADAIAQRASTLESENAAILEAVRSEVARIADGVGAQVSKVSREVDRVGPTLGEHLDVIRAELAAVRDARAADDSDALALSIREPIIAEVETSIGAVRAVLSDGINDLSARLGALAGSPQIDAVLARLGDLATAPQLDALAARVAELATAPQVQDLTSRLSELASSQVEGLGARLSELATASSVAGVASDLEGLARAEQLEQILDRIRVPGAAEIVEPVVADLRAALEGVRSQLEDELRSTAARVAETASGLDTRSRGYHDAVADIAARFEEVSTRVSGRLDAVESATGKLIVEVRDTLEKGTGAARSALAENVREIADRAEGITAVVRAAKTEIDAVAARNEEALTSMAERIAAIETGVAGLPTDRTLDEIRREAGAIAGNLNEVWMRVRSLLQITEEVPQLFEGHVESILDRLDRGVKRLDDIARRTDARVAERMGELEARVINALGRVEARDGAFTEALLTIAERLPRRERKRLGERLAPWRRRAGTGEGEAAPPVTQVPLRSTERPSTERPSTVATSITATTKPGGLPLDEEAVEGGAPGASGSTADPRASAEPGAKASGAKKAAPKKKAAKKPAKKAPAKKPAAKKAAAKKPAAKRAAKPAATKTTAKKTTGKGATSKDAAPAPAAPEPATGAPPGPGVPPGGGPAPRRETPKGPGAPGERGSGDENVSRSKPGAPEPGEGAATRGDVRPGGPPPAAPAGRPGGDGGGVPRPGPAPADPEGGEPGGTGS